MALTWSPAFNASDFTIQPTNGQCLMSSLVIANGTVGNNFMHVSVIQSMASNTTAAGANFTIWICSLKADGSTYWAPLTPGTAGSPVPPWPQSVTIPLYAAPTQTLLVGSTADVGTPINIPQTSFRLILQNNSGFTLTGTTQNWSYASF